MLNSKLTIVGLCLLMGMTHIMAGQKDNSNCCQPKPVGGIKSLERNTVYPLFQKLQGNNADVILNFHVDKHGRVSNIIVAESGGMMFDRSAVTAVMNTKWTPAKQNGFPVALTFALPFEYRTN